MTAKRNRQSIAILRVRKSSTSAKLGLFLGLFLLFIASSSNNPILNTSLSLHAQSQNNAADTESFFTKDLLEKTVRQGEIFSLRVILENSKESLALSEINTNFLQALSFSSDAYSFTLRFRALKVGQTKLVIDKIASSIDAAYLVYLITIQAQPNNALSETPGDSSKQQTALEGSLLGENQEAQKKAYRDYKSIYSLLYDNGHEGIPSSFNSRLERIDKGISLLQKTANAQNAWLQDGESARYYFSLLLVQVFAELKRISPTSSSRGNSSFLSSRLEKLVPLQEKLLAHIQEMKNFNETAVFNGLDTAFYENRANRDKEDLGLLLFSYGQSLADLGRNNQAIAVLEIVEKRYSPFKVYVETLYQLANLHFQEQSYQLAFEGYQNYLSQSKNTDFMIKSSGASPLKALATSKQIQDSDESAKAAALADTLLGWQELRKSRSSQQELSSFFHLGFISEKVSDFLNFELAYQFYKAVVEHSSAKDYPEYLKEASGRLFFLDEHFFKAR